MICVRQLVVFPGTSKVTWPKNSDSKERVLDDLPNCTSYPSVLCSS